MKHLSKAIVAFSLLAAASAVHAQTSYYGTDFNGTAGYPYTDPTVYADGFTPLGGQGSPAWTSTTGAAVTVASSGGPIVAQVYSGDGTTTATHESGTPTVGGYYFSSGFTIEPNNASGLSTDPESAGNKFSYTFNSATGTPIFSVVFTPTVVTGGVEGAYQPSLVNDILGTTVATGTTGPLVDTFYHLNISVSTAGAVSATLGTANSTVSGTIAGSDAIGSFSIAENDVSTAGVYDDAITLNDVSVVIPEPSTYAMMGMGLLGMLGLMKFRRAKA